MLCCPLDGVADPTVTSEEELKRHDLERTSDTNDVAKAACGSLCVEAPLQVEQLSLHSSTAMTKHAGMEGAHCAAFSVGLAAIIVPTQPHSFFSA